MNWSNVTHLTPLHYMEVVPGDTVRGKFTVNCISNPTVRPILNPMYMDIYAYYIPYRLLWPDWPDWISDRDSSESIPTVSDLFEENFEKVFVASATTNLCWLRRAYNMVFNEFFTYEGFQTDMDLDANASLQAVLKRPSTFDAAVVEDTVDVDGESIGSTTQSLREALATEAQKIAAEFYGERYVDTLARVGVNIREELLEVPEVIGTRHSNWDYRMVAGTGSGAEGDQGGYFNTTSEVTIRPTFCKEHGLIALFGCTRGDLVRTDGMNYPLLEKTSVEDYWMPEREVNIIKAWKNRTFQNGSADTTTADEFYTPNFQDLRQGININAAPSGTWVPATSDGYFAYTTQSEDKDDFLRHLASDFSSFFATDRMSLGNMQWTVRPRLDKISPVSPPLVVKRSFI